MEKEEELYEPIKLALHEGFSANAECHLEVTANKISEGLKRFLDDQAVFILGTERRNPDIMGYITITHKTGYQERRLVVVEVKRESLTFDDIYQVKKYAEMFNAHYAFLISPEGFSEARRRFLRNGFLLSYFGYRTIIVMLFVEGKYLERDKFLCNRNPFMLL